MLMYIATDMGGSGVTRTPGESASHGREWSHRIKLGASAWWTTATGVIWEGVELYDGIK